MPIDDNRKRLYTRRAITTLPDAKAMAIDSFTEILDEKQLRERIDGKTADWLVNGSILGSENTKEEDPEKRGHYGVVNIINQDATLEIFDESGAQCGTVMLYTLLAQRAGLGYARISAIQQCLANGQSVKIAHAIYRLARD